MAGWGRTGAAAWSHPTGRGITRARVSGGGGEPQTSVAGPQFFLGRPSINDDRRLFIATG